MPIFEYQCNACEIRFEVLQRTNKVNKSLKCPTCGKQDTKKRFSAFAAMGTQKKTTKDNTT
jgi:putative FmdB family regulatory protein